MSLRRGWRHVKDFLRKAYEDNLTGQSAMVAYNMLLSILPLALLALFIAGKVLQSSEIESSVLRDLRRAFPNTADGTIRSALHGAQRYSTQLGIAAVVASVWIGSSFWGALDTAFCRIYHVRCRSWLEQKRFAFAMLGVVLLFMAATVLVPALQSLLVDSTRDLPFGLSKVRGVIYAITLLASVVVLFGIVCVIYRAVPNRGVPWRAIWPGAIGATVAIAIVDYAFPFYITNVSTITRVGSTLVFILIVLLWFYALAIILLSGATINALRFERHDTAEREAAAAAVREGCGDCGDA